MTHTPDSALRWRVLLDERVAEAGAVLGSVPGVRGLVLAESVGRGEAWPLSDIDMLPISADVADTTGEIERRRAELVDWWAASGRSQTLDVGWLHFSEVEVAHAINQSPAQTAALMNDRRWLHGMDKAYGGRGSSNTAGPAKSFADWATFMRFEPLVVAARVQQWVAQVHAARAEVVQFSARGDAVHATLALRTAARALRLALVEGWSERLGSMGREWTIFERMARRYGAEDMAYQLALLADALPAHALERAAEAPVWLQERYRSRVCRTADGG